MRCVPSLATCALPALPPCHPSKCKGILLESVLTAIQGEGKGDSCLEPWEANLYSDSMVRLMLEELPNVCTSGF